MTRSHTPTRLVLCLSLLACVYHAYKSEASDLSCQCRWGGDKTAASQAVSILLYTSCNGNVTAAAEAIASAAVATNVKNADALATSLAFGLVSAGNNVRDLITASATSAFAKDGAAALGSGFAVAIMSVDPSLGAAFYDYLLQNFVMSMDSLVSLQGCNSQPIEKALVGFLYSLYQIDVPAFNTAVSYIIEAPVLGQCRMVEWLKYDDRLQEAMTSQEVQTVQTWLDAKAGKGLGRVNRPMFSSCAKQSRDSLAVSVDILIAKSECGAPPNTAQGAAVAVATAAINGGCSYTSALSLACTQATDPTLVYKSIQTVVTSLSAETSYKAGNAVAAAYTGACQSVLAPTGSGGSASFLEMVVQITQQNVALLGCDALIPFVQGLCATLTPLGVGPELTGLFNANPAANTCSFSCQ
eukprot:jgi/Chrzof1/13288/Cz07g27190.t1